jgi:hypothetical protein
LSSALDGGWPGGSARLVVPENGMGAAGGLIKIKTQPACCPMYDGDCLDLIGKNRNALSLRRRAFRPWRPLKTSATRSK